MRTFQASESKRYCGLSAATRHRCAGGEETMAKVHRKYPRTEPAHSFLHMPGSLTPPDAVADAADLLQKVTSYLEHPFNERQAEAFCRSLTERLFLLWGPPGPGKTTVVA